MVFLQESRLFHGRVHRSGGEHKLMGGDATEAFRTNTHGSDLNGYSRYGTPGFCRSWVLVSMVALGSHDPLFAAVTFRNFLCEMPRR
jgi:hypothetical protein